MARYSIEDTTLIALGDAIRNKTNAMADTEAVTVDSGNGFSSHSSSALYDCDGTEITTHAKPITIAGAKNIRVKLTSGTVNNLSAYVWIAPGYHTEMPADAIPQDGFATTTEYVFENTDSVTVGVEGTYGLVGYFCECIGEIKRGITPENMATEINNMGALLDPSLLTLTGNLNGKFAYSGMVDFINLYGDQMTTKDVYELDSAFTYSTLERLPFPINCADYLQTSLSNMCFNATKLKEAPILVDCTPKSISALFSGCNSLRELPEDYGADWDWSTIDNSTSSYLMCDARLKDCYSLRNAPMSLINHGGPKVNSATYTLYSNLFYNCYVLDEVVGLGWPHTDVAYNSSSSWSSPFGSLLYCNYRLKEFTFAEMATPPKWANQTLDLSGRGYCKESNYSYYICNSNSGITGDKRVYDDATYQALKNDPDWFSTVLEYSRYNHTSAVNTINSLPDCSAYQASGGGSANIIRFKQGEGSATDGGAVSDLTDEEIAVAAAKGWTVSIVM